MNETRRMVSHMELSILRKVDFLIPSVNRADMELKLLKLSNRAVKLGLPSVTFETLEKLSVRGKCSCKSTPHTTYCKWNQIAHFDIVQVNGPEEIKLKGWTLVAAIEHTHNEDEDNLVRRVSGHDLELPAYVYQGEPGCYHCMTNRNRNKTYLICNENGAMRQIGSSCLRDYTGHKNAEAIARWSELLFELTHKELDSEKWFSDKFTSVPELLRCAALAIRKEGWSSSSSPSSTAGLVGLLMSHDKDSDELRAEFGAPTEQDEEIAKGAALWAMQYEGTNDYRHNCKVIVKNGAVSREYFNLAVSIVASFSRAEARENKNVNRYPNSKHIGTIKKREEFTLTVEDEPRFIDNDWGGSFLYRFAEGDGNLCVWFGSGLLYDKETGVEVQKGDTIRVKATVKGHNDFMDNSQTQFTRVSLLEVL